MSSEYALFEMAVADLITSNHRSRSSKRNIVVNQIRSSKFPQQYIEHLIETCSTRGGVDGLDMAIDILRFFGDHLIQFSRDLRRKDAGRWSSGRNSCHHHHDDAWYIILRAAARSDLEQQRKLYLFQEATRGPVSVREAVAHAYGDMGGEVARRGLQGLLKDEKVEVVSEAIKEALGSFQ